MHRDGIEMVEEMLRQTTGEKTGADQESEPTNTSGKSEPNGYATNTYATDTFNSWTLTCPGTADHNTPESVQDRTRGHGW